MLMETHACNRTAESQLDAEVRDSSQFEMPTPHMFVPSHLMVHQILYLNFGKGFKRTTHSELITDVKVPTVVYSQYAVSQH